MDGRMPLKEKDAVCGYTILSLLSQAGGSSLTYYAVRNEDKQLTVLKELYPEEMNEVIERSGQRLSLKDDVSKWVRVKWEEYVENFRREGWRSRELLQKAAKAVIGTDGAAMAPEYAFFNSEPFEANGTWYIAISTGSGEAVSGKDKPLAEILEIMRAVCSAVKSLHEAGYAHFDIKPDNLFRMSSGQVKLLDFGSVQDSVVEKRMSYSYSEGFSAPEIKVRDFLSGSQADVYSAAAVFFYMLYDCRISDIKQLHNEIPEAKLLKKETFPTKLLGCSHSVIEAVFSVLRRSMNQYSRSRMERIDELQEGIEHIIELFRRDEEPLGQNNADPDEIVRRMCEVYALETMIPFYPAAKKYFSEKLVVQLREAVHLGGVFNACIDAVRRKLYIAAEYEKSLYCLLFLEDNANIAAQYKSERKKLYDFIVACCDKLGIERMSKVYREKSGKIKVPVTEREKYLFDTSLRKLSMYEAKFDFESMFSEAASFVESIWAENGEDAVGAVCAQDEVDKILAIHAGSLAETICLCRCEGWQQQAEKIMRHVADGLFDKKDTFRDRSIDNLLHFAVETNDKKLFEVSLGQLSEMHALHFEGTFSLGRWIADSAKNFAETQNVDAYALYLFFKSINRLYADELSAADKDVLWKMLKREREKDVCLAHPWSLIYAHAAMLALHIIRSSGKMTDSVYKGFCGMLEKTVVGSVYGIVSAIARSAYLTVRKAEGNERYIEKAYRELREELENGIKGGVFCGAYFDGALEADDAEALLQKFRFKHA